MNKYLVKLASSGFLNKTLAFADDVLGNRVRSLSNEASTLARAEALNRKAKDAFTDLARAKSDTLKARIKLGAGSAAALVGGALGHKAYSDHRNSAILQHIDDQFHQSSN